MPAGRLVFNLSCERGPPPRQSTVNCSPASDRTRLGCIDDACPAIVELPLQVSLHVTFVSISCSWSCTTLVPLTPGVDVLCSQLLIYNSR